MKNKQIAIALLSLTTLTFGCNKTQTTSEQIDQLKAETKEAAQDIKEYTYSQKGEFVEKMQGSLAQINRGLEQLTAKVEKSSDAAKAEAKPKLDALRAQTAKLTQQLEEARNAPESAWESVRTGVKKGFNEVKDGFQQATDWVSKKITT